ncbi:MAG TPA: SsrA-binding protein SmpB [bacterium]|nr:SsrA-binding protein SmpB [bacterium]
MKPIALNRKASFEYFLFDKFEAGICLLGSEVKSVREGKVNLKDSFVRIERDEAFLHNFYISPYSKIQGFVDIDPTRYRKLLLKRAEINRLLGLSKQKGYSIIPLSIYFKRGLVKIEIALAKGKKQFDKRASIKKRIHDRESQAAVKFHARKKQ